jgi:uncharacterized membrane protein
LLSNSIEARYWMDSSSSAPPLASAPNLSPVIARNIRTLFERRVRDDGKRSRENRVADSITRFTGGMLFVYLHALAFGI